MEVDVAVGRREEGKKGRREEGKKGRETGREHYTTYTDVTPQRRSIKNWRLRDCPLLIHKPTSANTHGFEENVLLRVTVGRDVHGLQQWHAATRGSEEKNLHPPNVSNFISCFAQK
jgi:hypothetical protein